MLELCGLGCYRGGRLLFSNLSSVVSAGQALQVVGPNGSGKTSLLRIVAGLLRPQAGQVRWDNRTPVPLGELLYIGHAAGLKEELNPLENLQLDCALYGGKITPMAALEAMGVAAFARLPASTLSAGQRRLVGLARLCTRVVPLWLLDEPYALLDLAARARVRACIETHCQAGGIAVLALHEPVPLNVPVIHRCALPLHP